MKLRWLISLVVPTGIALGIIGGFGLAAPSKSAYVIIEFDQITDVPAYETLKKSMGIQAAVAAEIADGRYLARSEKVTALDGTPPKSVVIIAFQSEAKAKSFYENTKEITAMRLKAAKSRAFILGVCSERGSLASDC